MKRTLMGAAVVLAAFGAQAQTVWRCGSVYSDAPCPEGRGVAVADVRSEGQRAEGRDAAARDRALARQLVNERHEREREFAQQGNGLMGIAPAMPQPAAVKTKKKPKSKRQRPEAPDIYRGAAVSSR